MNKKYIGIGASIIALLFALLSPASPVSVGGAGLGTNLQIATTTSVTSSIVKIFDATNFCRARAITTVGAEITITFGDPTNGDVSSTTLSDVIGHVQAASTTVIYSSDDVGCADWYAHGETTSVITTSQF